MSSSCWAATFFSALRCSVTFVNSTQVRRSNEREPAGRRPPVLQSSRGPIQLSLFDHLEPVTQPLQVPEGDAATAIDARAVSSPDDSDCSGD